MKIKNGELFESTDGLILATSCSVITIDSFLVMGAGAALQLKKLIPKIDAFFGKHIEHLSLYGVMIYDKPVNYKYYGIFQTKRDYRNPSDLNIIYYSAKMLNEMLNNSHSRFYNSTVSVNFPGIGLGGLTMEQVLPAIVNLPDNVTFYVK